MEPTTLQDENGRVVMSGIHTYGETVHLFIERGDYNGVFMPGFQKWESNYNPPETGLLYVDHCVGNVGWNQMNPWVKFYEDVMGFRNILTFDDNDISTEYSALMSKGDEQRQRLREVPDQRAGRGEEEVAGRGVSRFLRRRRRAALRARDERHRQNGERSAEPRRRVPQDPGQLLRDGARSRRQDR